MSNIGVIRDVKFCPPSGDLSSDLALTASVDKTLKLTDLNSKKVVVT